jgi:Asparaginase, N-terminal
VQISGADVGLWRDSDPRRSRNGGIAKSGDRARRVSLLVQVEMPIVFTAAMRRPDQPSADGPANRLAASLVAISPASRGKGILVVADDEIHAGPLIRKAHSFRPHAFSSLPFGPNGYVAEERVRFALAPASRPPRLTYGGGAPVQGMKSSPGQTIETGRDTGIENLAGRIVHLSSLTCRPTEYREITPGDRTRWLGDLDSNQD